MLSDFLKIRNIPRPDLRDGFFLNAPMLEKEIEVQHGIKISTPDLYKIDNKLLLQYVPFFEVRDPEKIREVTDKYPSINSPCSMSLDSLEELSDQMIKSYQISYFHYALGKKNYTNFPYLCCGKSTKNVVLSMFKAGFPNAAYASSGDHAYVILPFIFEKKGITGTLIVDPTYNQLTLKDEEKNAVIIKLGDRWRYYNPSTQRNMFPEIVLSIDSIKKSQLIDISGYYNGREFFEKAFANPVKVTNTLN